MGEVLTDRLAYEVLSLVEEIPRGKVATYGQLARLCGRENNSRLVARILSHASIYGEFPCHRVVNSQGRTAANWPEQIALLEEEGICFSKAWRISLETYQWKP